MSKSAEQLFPKPTDARLRIYAWKPASPAPVYEGLLKVGQTTGDVNSRIRQSQGQMPHEYVLLVDESAEKADGTVIRDYQVRARLVEKGFKNVRILGAREWMECSAEDVKVAIRELRTGKRSLESRTEDFEPRAEQAAAISRTLEYYKSIWAEDEDAVPHFLWNAKMRFGKTFAAYQLAKKMGATRVLVVTFKPAVEDAWRADLQSHVDFEGWQYVSSNVGNISEIDESRPLVYFGSFQDLLGKDRKTGVIKSKNEWIHVLNWDLVIFDEYHFGAWRENAKELFEGEDPYVAQQEIANEHGTGLAAVGEELEEWGNHEDQFLPITTNAYLYLSGTPFKALSTGQFIEEQIFNWTYTDEQKAKKEAEQKAPGCWNPYSALPEMRLLTYQMPDDLIAVAHQGEFNEFDLNAFFEAEGEGENAEFVHKDEVQKWLNIIRGSDRLVQQNALKTKSGLPYPYSNTRLLRYLRHSFWFLPNVAACQAMANLLAEPQNVFWHEYTVLVVAGKGAGIGVKALGPVRDAIGNGHDTKTITLSCGKLTTGVTVPQWASILMLRNLQSPETYFQAAFRVQSPWAIKNPDGDDPNQEEVLKPVCFVFDFAPSRALRQIAEYGQGLSPNEPNPEQAVHDLVKFLPVLAFDGSNLVQIDATGVLDMAMSGTSATLLAKKWESALLVNVDNATLRKILENEDALDAVMSIEGFRAMGSDVLETVVNMSEAIRETKRKKGAKLSTSQRNKLNREASKYRATRKDIREKLLKFAARIPAFMYLTDYREKALVDIIRRIEPELFKTVTGLTVEDFNLLVSIGVFNAAHMNEAIHAFRRYEDSSLAYTGIESHADLREYGLFDTVVLQD